MDITAREVMDTNFSTLSPRMTIAEAMRVFQTAGRSTGKSSSAWW